MAVYVFFAVSLVGEQWIIWKQEGDEEVDLYYPVFMTVRQLLFDITCSTEINFLFLFTNISDL